MTVCWSAGVPSDHLVKFGDRLRHFPTGGIGHIIGKEGKIREDVHVIGKTLEGGVGTTVSVVQGSMGPTGAQNQHHTQL